MDEAHVMASDLDFPLFAALRDTSVSVHLHCYPPKTSRELMELADVVKPFTPFSTLRWLKHERADSFVVRHIDFADHQFGAPIKVGELNGLPRLQTDIEGITNYFGRSMAFNPGSMISASKWEYVAARHETDWSQRIFFSPE